MIKGMVSIGLMAATCLATFPANAEPITLLDMRLEFQKRSYERIDVAYRNGHPVLTASIFGQSFNAVLRECEGVDIACEAVRYTSCIEFPEGSVVDPYRVANAYNSGFRPGAAFVPESSRTRQVCLRMHQRFAGTEKFGFEEIYDWQSTLEDFILDVEDEIRIRTEAYGAPSN